MVDQPILEEQEIVMMHKMMYTVVLFFGLYIFVFGGTTVVFGVHETIMDVQSGAPAMTVFIDVAMTICSLLGFTLCGFIVIYVSRTARGKRDEILHNN